MTHAEIQDLLDKTAAGLAEHFDAVQILVSWNEGEKTQMQPSGRGNWYARRAMCEEFVESDQRNDLARQIAEKQEPPPEDWQADKQ